MTDGHEICKHCGHRIEQPQDGNWYDAAPWLHHVVTPYSEAWFLYCGDDYGTDAEPEEKICD